MQNRQPTPPSAWFGFESHRYRPTYPRYCPTYPKDDIEVRVLVRTRNLEQALFSVPNPFDDENYGDFELGGAGLRTADAETRKPGHGDHFARQRRHQVGLPRLHRPQ
jgi:hypothetical protein